MTEQPVAARPKGQQPASPQPQMQPAVPMVPVMEIAGEPPKRGPGRPPKPDLFSVLVRISEELRGVDPESRVQILQTLTNLSK